MDEPIRRLWEAVLRQALEDALSPRSGPLARAVARAWFLSDQPEPGGFRWTAELLEVDPAPIRRRLRTPVSGDREVWSEIARDGLFAA